MGVITPPNGKSGRAPLRLCAIVLCALCTLAFIPAALLAYIGALWIGGIDGPASASAAALVAAPVPLAFAALSAWKAARRRAWEPLLAAAAAMLGAAALYAVALAWGGRMLI
jgi:hypothetical protein